MRRDVLELDTTSQSEPRGGDLALLDVEAIRLLMTGSSIIDWQRLAFDNREQVDAFLALHLIDMTVPLDRERLRYVYNEAVSYLEEHLHLRFPAELRNPADPRDVFVWASQQGGFRRRQILSCVILKLVHVIHHMEAADLKHKSPISEERLFDHAEARILRSARQLRETGLPIVSFYGSRKTRSSIITKLLAKKENLAATIFDKLRFRIVVAQHEDVVPVLAEMCRTMFAFNYGIPGQSHNNLVDAGTALAAATTAVDPADLSTEDGPTPTARNEFSGASYRMINFIVDYPVRLPDFESTTFGFELGRVVYVMVEFQLLDEETARQNEEGENAHHLYKLRQEDVVARRLKRGASRREDA